MLSQGFILYLRNISQEKFVDIATNGLGPLRCGMSLIRGYYGGQNGIRTHGDVAAMMKFEIQLRANRPPKTDTE